MLDQARQIITLLPPAEAGKCVLDVTGNLYRGSAEELGNSMRSGNLVFHSGRLRGALPRILG